MDNMTVYEKNRVLKESLITRKVYCGLLSRGQEIGSGSYERMLVSFTEPSKGQVTNSGDIEFPVAKEMWGDVTDIALYDAKSGGNIVWLGQPEVVKKVSIASQYKIPKGYMIVRFK